MANIVLNDLLAVFFLLGLTVIYFPQFYKIIKKKTSIGFSVWFMFLGHTASFLSCLNALIFYINNWWTCHGSLNCTEKFLGFGLIIIQWLLYWMQYVLFVWYYPYKQTDSLIAGEKPHRKRLKLQTITFIASHVIGLIYLGVTLGLLGHHGWRNASSSDLRTWSTIMEVTISVMFLSHYIPQIWETYRLKKVGSLSLVTLALMTPGTFAWTVFLATQSSLVPNSQGSDPSVWVPYLIVGAFQAVLLAIGIYYDRKEKKRDQYRLLLDDLEKDMGGAKYDELSPDFEVVSN